jgi:fused signal recognition particle receptor
VGVNGGGKTTTIGKLAHKLTTEGANVMLAAGDTFRAAACEQVEGLCLRTTCVGCSARERTVAACGDLTRRSSYG